MITLISNKISSDGIYQIDVNSSDIVGILITTEAGSLNVYNIYLDFSHSQEILTLTESIADRKRTAARGTSKHLMLTGDFNRHHSL